MHFVKWIGVLVIAAFAFLGGIWLSAFEQARCRQARAFLALLEYMRRQIECFSLPVPQILQEADASLLAACGVEERPRDFASLLQDCELLLPARYCTLLAEFSAELGTAYRSEQLRACTYYTAQLTPLCEEIERELQRRSSLWRLLPGAVGAALILMLI